MAKCGPDCEQTLREIERWLDGELDPNLHTEVDTHLSACHPCMQRAEFRRHLKTVIQTKCAGDALPPDLQRKLEGIIGSLEASSD